MLRTWLRSRLNHRLPWGPRFHSRYGGLLTDRLDARAEIARRVERGTLPAALQEDLLRFVENGYVILRGAVPEHVIDAVRADVERAWSDDAAGHMLDIHGDVRPLERSLRGGPCKLLDVHRSSHATREAIFAPHIAAFLGAIFEGPTLAFQSLSFDRGTEQAIHQDTAYVVVSEPMKLAASWIALEDVQPGTGELQYYEGSHRLPDFPFPRGRKSWKPTTDGPTVHERFLAQLHAEAESRALPLKRFLPKKGDALIWSADLAHGGSPVENGDATRRSLVTHYCPAHVRPNYMRVFGRMRPIHTHRADCHYASALEEPTGLSGELGRLVAR